VNARSSVCVGLGFGALLLALGCQSVIGTKDRTLDPSLKVDDGSASPECTKYCATVMANCTDKSAQYVSLPVCLADCSHLPTAAPGASFGNSVQCRQLEATLAGSTGEPADHCPAAGPAGNGQCGTTCESYCSLIIPTCPTAFGSLAECEFACRSMPDLKSYDTSDQRGDSVQCRIFHVSAGTQSPSSHCPHAGKVSTNYCVDSDAGVEAPSCDPPPDAEHCDKCEYKLCCQEVNDCYADTICDTADQDLDACEALAADMDASSDDCKAKFIATNAHAAALDTCKSKHCATECGLPTPTP
jgi:hypothetical protein